MLPVLSSILRPFGPRVQYLNQSERMAVGVTAGSMVDTHLELLHQYEDKSAWELWCAIEALHVQKVANLCHAAWPNLLGIRHDEDQTYSKYLRRLNDVRAGVDRVTRVISVESRMDELVLFAALSRKRSDNPLRRSLLAHRNLSLADLPAVFRTSPSLKPVRRAIRLVNGKVVYSKGLGIIRFLSDWGFYVSIHKVLFVLSLAVNLFTFNKFARNECDTYSEVVDFPLRRWINLDTGATEFMATICSDDLAYLNWNPAPTVEHAKSPIANDTRDLITCSRGPQYWGYRTSTVLLPVNFAKPVSTEAHQGGEHRACGSAANRVFDVHTCAAIMATCIRSHLSATILSSQRSN